MTTERRAKYVDHVIDARTTLRALENDGRRIIEGIATTPNVDRVGDIVLPKGARFQLPLPLLFSHDADRPIGNVTSAVVTDEGISFSAEVAPAGVASIIDQRWQEIKSGLWRAVSIGFRAESSTATKTGRQFDLWEWLELSLVSIPANADCAITAVKAFSVPAREVSTTRVIAGASAPVASITGHKAMNANATLADKIKTAQANVNATLDRMAELGKQDELDDVARTEIDELEKTLDAAEKTLSGYEAIEKRTTGLVRPVTPATTNARDVPHVAPEFRSTVKADLLWKNAAAHLRAHIERRSVADVIASHYPGHAMLETYSKAATPAAIAVTSVPAWAGVLVETQVGEFLESLKPFSVYGQLSDYGVSFSLSRGPVKVPSRLATPNLAADFVGEAQPIRVGQGAFTSITLNGHKLGVISTFSRDIALQTNNQIERLIRDGILEDTSTGLDQKLLDAVAGTAIRPAGLTNGVTGIPSSGVLAENIATDVRAAMAPIIAANGGRTLVWIMNPARALGLAFVQTAAGNYLYKESLDSGTFMGGRVIVSTNVPADKVYLVDAADFVTAADDTPEWSVSDVATLHMEQSQPDAKVIVGGTAAAPTPAAPVSSLWQQASIGIRMIQDMSWAMRRPGMVSMLTGVAW